jgi:hypothetical protein
MKLPQSYVPHLDHRITVLMTFTVRREEGFFGSDHGEPRELGDLYRGSLEGSGIMLRMLLEFLGVKTDSKNSGKLMPSGKRDAVLGQGSLAAIAPVEISKMDSPTEQFLARMHDEASKRTAHPAFHKFTLGLDPDELRKATKWVVREIWDRCYDPDAITVHRDLFRLLAGGKWEGIPFTPAA